MRLIDWPPMKNAELPPFALVRSSELFTRTPSIYMMGSVPSDADLVPRILIWPAEPTFPWVVIMFTPAVRP
jgi:hypothetical protein